MTGEDSKSVIVKSIIDMAHTLGITVVAEGIEAQKALADLYAMGCDSGQGYFISRPMDIENSYKWLENYKPITDF